MKQKMESICNCIFVHGVAHYQPKCRNRHMILPFDISKDPVAHYTAMIRFNLLKVLSPTEYIVQPLQMKSDKWRSINSINSFQFHMNPSFIAHYNNFSNRTVQQPIELGFLCVTMKEDVPYRCEIIRCHKKQ